jgi:hypothetical protein
MVAVPPVASVPFVAAAVAGIVPGPLLVIHSGAQETHSSRSGSGSQVSATDAAGSP